MNSVQSYLPVRDAKSHAFQHRATEIAFKDEANYISNGKVIIEVNIEM